MGAAIPQVGPLPQLRPDIEFLPGPQDPDGSPAYVIHDPAAGTFDRATWTQAEILHRLRQPYTLAGLLADLARHTTIRASAKDVQLLCADAAARGLTRQVVSARTLEDQRRAARRRGLAALFRGLAFVRIPLLHPDPFLERTLGIARRLGGRAARWTYIWLAVLAGLLLMQRFDAYVATFPYFFKWSGAAAFTATLVAVKTLHEFGHAYTAKALGSSVRSMGVTLIFLFPVAYSDVTDSWRLPSRRRRLLISLAGVLVELVLGAAGLVVWAVSPPGLLNSVAFVVSSVTLLSTLLINLNPAMRYDGYYVLSDLLGIDNLQPLAFAAARRLLRRYLFGLQVDEARHGPDAGWSRSRRGLLVAYALYAWTYRLFLYSAIALLLYHRLTKAIGVVVLLGAWYTFIVRPVLTEVQTVWRMRRDWKLTLANITMGAALGLVLWWAAWPLPRWQRVPATTVARDTQVLYAPGDGLLRGVSTGGLEVGDAGAPPLAPGQRVTRGQTLCVLESPELEQLARLTRLEIARIELELNVLRNDASQRALLPPKLEELTRAGAKLESILTAITGNRVVAQIDGVVIEWDEGLRSGMPVGRGQELGQICSAAAPRVVAFIPAELSGAVGAGTRVVFYPDCRPQRVGGVVVFVDPLRVETLEHRGLASVAGGDIAVLADAAGRLRVRDSLYVAEIELDTPVELGNGQTGAVWVRTGPRSYVWDILRHAYRVALRESSF